MLATATSGKDMTASEGGYSIEVRTGDVFMRCDGLEVNIAPDGYIVHQTGLERVHFLNEPAALVFELCDGSHSTSAIEAAVAEAFARFNPPPLPETVRECLSRFIEEGLIERSLPRSSEP